MNNEPRLTPRERACALRAMRKQLNVLTEELERMIIHNDPDTAIEEKMGEVQCVQGVIRWLWRDGHSDAPNGSLPKL